MPSVRFKETLQKLSATHRKRVEAELSLWKTEGMINGIDCAQLAENVESESALSIKAFSKLLKSFADQLENNTGDLNIWRSLCFGLELHGPKVPPSVRPRLLGRAGKLKDYADHLGKNVPMKTAFHLLTKNAGKTTPLGALVRQMHQANLSIGKKLWATFSKPPQIDPLADMPQDTDGITICLGLGCYSNTAPYIVMQYDVSAPSSPSLHKPTIADAGTYSFFRSSKVPGDHWGMTEPLKVNPKNHQGRPELVHSQITGQSLVFPYFVSV